MKALEALPEAFLERFERIIPATDLRRALRSFITDKRTAFRVNTLVTDVVSVIVSLDREGLHAEPVPWSLDGFSVASDRRDALLSSAAYHRREIYIQNPSSMVPPLVLAPMPDEEVLDLTAAPGSKTHQMACMMGNTGRITAVESARPRYYKLRENMRLHAAENVRPFFQDGTTTWRHRPEFFDRVLLDAPCSSEGRFRTENPETTRYWSPKKIRDASRKQRRLLYSGIQCLKPGGRLVYSTCSFAPEENEVVVNKLMKKFPQALRIVPITMDIAALRAGLTEWEGRVFSADLSLAGRIVPDELMDGFFVCCIEKTVSTVTP